MTDTTTPTDELEHRDRVYLEKLRLAIDVILRVGEDPGGLPNVLESELFLYRDRCDRALLSLSDETVGKDSSAL